jgi:DinB superfamily
MNVETDPSALKQLEDLRISMVPVVSCGDRVFHGWNPEALAEFLGVEYTQVALLSPQNLAALLDRILEAAQRAVRQVPAEGLNVKVPNRDRTVRDLAYHLFRICLAYRDGLETRRYPEDWLREVPPAGANSAEIAAYGQEVRHRLAEWWSRPDPCEGPVDTYYGVQTAYQLLERTTWHAAQHLRQLYALLTQIGETPQDPLADTDFEGLPLPKGLW